MTSPGYAFEMTGNELLKYQLDQVGKQIDACLAGMSETAYATKCASNGMSPAEIRAHLGEKYEWGSFAIHDKSRSNVEKVYRDLRGSAIAAALSSDTDESQKSASEYLVGHDNYHVGQLVLARLLIEPDWDSYAIYA